MKPEPGSLPRATTLAHDWITGRVGEGDLVIDATAGNGHDTEFLARLVGESGKVIAFDVQEAALAATRARLEKGGWAGRVELRQESHDQIASGDEPVAAVMFNLGYLPGSDKVTVTTAATTLGALDGAIKRLRTGGLVTVVCYPGHQGGREEAEAVVEWARNLDPAEFRTIRCESLAFDRPPPFLVAVERKG